MKVRSLLCLLMPLLLLVVSCTRDPEKVKRAYVERGNEYYKNGKYKEASIMYRSALKKDLRYGEAYYRLGLAELNLGRIGDAVRSLRRGLELQPDNLDAATHLADIYLLVFLKDEKHSDEYRKELEGISAKVLHDAAGNDGGVASVSGEIAVQVPAAVS